MSVQWKSAARTVACVGVAAIVGAAPIGMGAQAPPAGAQAPAPAAGGRGGPPIAPQLFTIFDSNKDGSVTAAELKTAFDAWYDAADTQKSGSVSQEQLSTALNAALGPPKMRPVPAKEAPKVELPDTAVVQAMRAAGTSDEQIALVLKTLGPEPGRWPVPEPTKEPAKPAVRRGRPPKAEAKVEAKPEPAPEPAPEPQPEPAKAANGNGEAGNGELKSSGASEGSAMPADLENLLDEMLGAHPK